jgi:HAMP domain-containing protein
MVTAEWSEDQVLAVLRRFSEPGCRLISLSGAEAATTAEVAHEALFEHWQLLQDWLDEGREDLRFKRRLFTDVQEWQSLGKQEGSLWRSPLLDLLVQYHERYPTQMTELETEFLKASLRLRERTEQRETQLQASQASLKYSITAVIVALGIVLLGAVLWITSDHSMRTVRKEIARGEEVTLELLADLSRAALLTNEFADLQTFIEGTRRDPRVIAVVVGAANGRVVAATESDLIGAPLPDPGVAREHHSWRQTEIRGRTGVLGTTAIQFSDHSRLLAYGETRNLAVITFILGMVAISIVSLATGPLLTRRLGELVDVANMAELNQAKQPAPDCASGGEPLGRILLWPQHGRHRLSKDQIRLGVAYSWIVVMPLLVPLTYLYFATASLMEQQTTETIQAEITGLAEQYRDDGLEGLRQVIAQWSAAQPQRASVYLLTDPLGQPVAGNLSRWPEVAPDSDGWLTFTIDVRPDGATVEQRRARAQAFTVADGFRFLVGRDVEERLQIQTLIRQALGWGLAFTLLLGLAGGFLMSRGMLGRVDAINRTTRRIMAGDLSQRIALKGSRDEFDQLAANLNAMLDQIERSQQNAVETKRMRGRPESTKNL